MFPRIATSRKKNTYKYLVISESIRRNGKSTIRDIASLGKYKIKFSEREERHQIIPKVTDISAEQKKYFNMIGLKNPSNLEPFLW